MAARPIIDDLPDWPGRASATDPEGYTQAADEFCTQLPGFGQQANALGAYIEGVSDGIESSVEESAAAAQEAQQQASKARRALVEAQTAEQQAQVYAALAGSAAGLPALSGQANKVLAVKADESGVEFTDSVQAQFWEYSSAGSFTWEKPLGAQLVVVELIGGGGGAQARGASGEAWVAGGEGGHFARYTLLASTLAANIEVVVGTGGTGAEYSAATGGQPALGTDGGNSSFGAFIALGGQTPTETSTTPKGGVTRRAGRTGGAGGGESSTTTLPIPGYGAAEGSIDGGGGGGRALTGSTGATSATGGTSQNAGNGGNGTSLASNNATGASGIAPGGGGGAIASANPAHTLTAGAGARGRVRIWAF